MAPVFTGNWFGFGRSPGGAASAAESDFEASGGAIAEYTDPASQSWRCHIFTDSNQNFVVPSGGITGKVDVVVIGGGGGGGNGNGDQDTGKGGGGAGGLVFVNQVPISSVNITCPITVGEGSAGKWGKGANPAPGGAQIPNNNTNNGAPSIFTIPSGPYVFTALGGGGGGQSDQNWPGTFGSNEGHDGGSGGGGAGRGPGPYDGGAGNQPGQNPSMPWVTQWGSGGGTANGANQAGGAGGGGSETSGENCPAQTGGQGGDGTNDFIEDSSAKTTAFLKAIRIGTNDSNIGGTPSYPLPVQHNSPQTPGDYCVAGGGGGGTGTNGPDFSTTLSIGGRGGGGRAGLGRDVNQTGPNSSLLPVQYWGDIGGLDFTGSGGGGSSDDPLADTSPTVGQSGSMTGHGGKGVVVVRYKISSLITAASQYVTATGGTISTDGDYKVHTFPTSSNFVVTQLSDDDLYNSIEVMCLGGGGGGGKWSGAGGGGGGVAHSYFFPLPTVVAAPTLPSAIPLTIGGGSPDQPSNGPGAADGGDSKFGPTNYYMIGFGGGRAGYRGSPTALGRGFKGGNGGGGGGNGGDPTEAGNYQAGHTIQRGFENSANPHVHCYNWGWAGGMCSNPQGLAGGGGGCASYGTPGASGAHGGNGIAISISGSSTTYGGGGGGATPTNGANGGTGGGGGGGGPSAGGNGTDGLGGGGGGAYSNGPKGGAGGSGLVIVRYRYQ